MLAGIDGKYTHVFGHDGSDYALYEPGGSSNTLTEMLPNHGYWILMTEAASLLVGGSISTAGVTLPAQTPVLVGMPGLASRRVEKLQSAYADILTIWAYARNSDTWSCYDATAPAFVNTLAAAAPGQGLWILADEETTIDVPSGLPSKVSDYHPDHLGSTNVVADAAGGLISETEYYPFGKPRADFVVPGKAFDPYYSFTGKEEDQSESGLHYFEMRFLQSLMGWFITVDPFLSAAESRSDTPYLATLSAGPGNQFEEDRARVLSSPQRLNSYAYVLNNPLRYDDPMGLDESDVTGIPSNVQPDKQPTLEITWTDHQTNSKGEEVVTGTFNLIDASGKSLLKGHVMAPKENHQPPGVSVAVATQNSGENSNTGKKSKAIRLASEIGRYRDVHAGNYRVNTTGCTLVAIGHVKNGILGLGTSQAAMKPIHKAFREAGGGTVIVRDLTKPEGSW